MLIDGYEYAPYWARYALGFGAFFILVRQLVAHLPDGDQTP